MALEIVDTSQSATTRKTIRGIEQVAAGKTLKIETSPDGIDILELTVPAGKSWEVHFSIEIVET